jgi:polysaccharide pyruvyl transferase WcaK-like protein
MITRRTALSAMALGLGAANQACAPKKKFVILLRSGWQTVNIGDIAHTPGVLTVIERNIPYAEVILWPGRPLDLGAGPLLRRRFPNLRILSDSQEELREAFSAADLFLHGSAAGVSSQAQAFAWRKETGKPYGFFGVGFSPAGEAASPRITPELRDLLSGSNFVFTRETASLANLKKVGIEGPELRFAPDGTFSMDLEDDASAAAFMKRNSLEPKRFIAVVPRLRYTPYHKFRNVDWTEDEIRRRTTVNDRYAEADHSKLREVVQAWVKETGYKALLCPEMTYELEIIDPLLFDPLPAGVKQNVVRRQNFWLPDEAASVYRHAVAVISFECHSPIIAAGQGTPCMYVHQPEDGIKGQMWKDLGLGDWYFEIENTSGSTIAERLFQIHKNYEEAQRTVREAVSRAQRLQADAMGWIHKQVGAST